MHGFKAVDRFLLMYFEVHSIGDARCDCQANSMLTISGSVWLGTQSKSVYKLHPSLNIETRPIVDKYSDGKLKRALEKEFKRT